MAQPYQIKCQIANKSGVEEDSIPSTTALKHHWKRTDFVGKLWANAHLENIPFSPCDLNESGYRLKNYEIEVVWDDEATLTAVRSSTEHLLLPM